MLVKRILTMKMTFTNCSSPVLHPSEMF